MQPIYLHNTLTNSREVFRPIKEGAVKMYHCGPTVYNYIHIGNLRSFVLADTLRRVFEFNGYKVTQVMNITDVGHLTSDADAGEDKMTKALLQNGKELTLENMKNLANFYTQAFIDDLESLKILKPHFLPMASENINEDIDLISRLNEKGLVYKTSDGMYFDTKKFPEYGKLGGISAVDESELKSRLADTKNDANSMAQKSEKKDPRDFALWKFNDKIGFPSPFGQGFPGWHIECSAMSMKYLGEHFDIHTGGIDHIPVHHNNEIAQSEAATGKILANYWLHGAFLNFRDNKMARSSGEFITLKKLVDDGYSPFDYRYLLSSANWSTSINFNFESLKSAKQARRKVLEHIAEMLDSTKNNQSKTPNIEYVNKFTDTINNNLDMPGALALLWEIIKDKNLPVDEKLSTIFLFDTVLALNLENDVNILLIENRKSTSALSEELKTLISERDTARKNKNWSLSDELRDKIIALGYEVIDTDTGTTVKKQG